MSRLTRLTLVCRGATEANRASVFGLDAPLPPQEAARAFARLAGFSPRPDHLFSAPEAAARATAEGFGIEYALEPVFADLDYGDWRGRSLTEVAAADPAGLDAWLRDAGAAPHGGESLAAFSRRVSGWLAAENGRGGHAAVVTHGAVIRAMALAALDAPLSCFWRIDVAPLTVTELRSDGRRWAVHSLGA